MKIALSLFLALAIAVQLSSDPELKGLSGGISMGYTVRYPADGSDSDRLPLLIALHGNGDTVGGFHDTALLGVQEPCRIVLLKGPLSYAGGGAWPFTVADLERYGLAVDDAVARLLAEYPTRGKPVLLGFSGGGTMAYYQALHHGDRYSLIVPVSGSLSVKAAPVHRPGTRASVAAFHGKTDRVIPFIEGQVAARSLEDDGLAVTFTEFDGGHLAFFRTMNATILEVVSEGLRNTGG